MLRRLYVHNFCTLVNFTIEFDALNLLMGSNGSGKSSVLDVLFRLGKFLSGDSGRVEEFFPPEDLTRWEEEAGIHQHIELTFEIDGDFYHYILRVDHAGSSRGPRIGLEELRHNSHPLYQFETASENVATIYNDDYSVSGKFLTDGRRSGIQTFSGGVKSEKFNIFQAALRSMFIIKFNPSQISSESAGEEEKPSHDLKNFASWYRYLSQSHPSRIFELTTALRDVLPGFDCMSFQTAGESKFLNVEFHHEHGRSLSYRLGQLSDGQKALIILYTLLYCLPRNGGILCIDEPENFLALPEIQLWLDVLERKVLAGQIQSILISHHPRLINMLAGDCGQWLYRDGANSPTRVKPVSLDAPDGLSAARLVEMGWLVND